jgi:4-amino-4-deoxy-L-arabinose transferase-like glycosyltransferase
MTAAGAMAATIGRTDDATRVAEMIAVTGAATGAIGVAIVALIGRIIAIARVAGPNGAMTAGVIAMCRCAFAAKKAIRRAGAQSHD